MLPLHLYSLISIVHIIVQRRKEIFPGSPAQANFNNILFISRILEVSLGMYLLPCLFTKWILSTKTPTGAELRLVSLVHRNFLELKKIYIFLEEFEYSQHQEMINV
jgi:hypothetical protein